MNIKNNKIDLIDEKNSRTTCEEDLASCVDTFSSLTDSNISLRESNMSLRDELKFFTLNAISFDKENKKFLIYLSLEKIEEPKAEITEYIDSFEKNEILYEMQDNKIFIIKYNDEKIIEITGEINNDIKILHKIYSTKSGTITLHEDYLLEFGFGSINMPTVKNLKSFEYTMYTNTDIPEELRDILYLIAQYIPTQHINPPKKIYYFNQLN